MLRESDGGKQIRRRSLSCNGTSAHLLGIEVTRYRYVTTERKAHDPLAETRKAYVTQWHIWPADALC
jgi:hypothetical protein